MEKIKPIAKEPNDRVFGFYEARRKLDVGQDVVANVIGMHRSEYSYLETLTYEELDKITTALGIKGNPIQARSKQ